MFCARCGQQIPDASIFCQVCGQHATLTLDAVQPPAPNKLRPSYASVTIPQNIGISGIGGWLLFYCIAASIFAPLFVFRQMHVALRFNNPVYLFGQFRLLYGAVVGVFLWMKRPVALLLLRIYFIVVAAELLLAIVRLIFLAQSRHIPLVATSNFDSTLAAIGFAFAWFLYFRMSERVRNTYGANI